MRIRHPPDDPAKVGWIFYRPLSIFVAGLTQAKKVTKMLDTVKFLLGGFACYFLINVVLYLFGLPSTRQITHTIMDRPEQRQQQPQYPQPQYPQPVPTQNQNWSQLEYSDDFRPYLDGSLHNR